MQQQATEKFNTRVSYIPRDFFGKQKKDGTAGLFLSPVGSRLTGSKILTLGLINTENVMFGSLNRITYSDIRTELHLANATIARNLRELSDDGQIERKYSKCKITLDYAQENSFPVYHFLLENKVDFGGVVKRLSHNAILYLCEMINFYLTPEEKRKNKMQAHFIGGINRIAKTLNIPNGTACGVIKELIDTKCIFRNKLVRDNAGNEMLSVGKGNSRTSLTVYKVNSKLINRCKAILKRLEDNKKLKKLGGAVPEQKHGESIQASQPDSVATDSRDKYFLDIQNERKFLKIEVDFAFDVAYSNLKNQYKELRRKFFEAVKRHDADSLDEIGTKLKCITENIRLYLINSGVPPENIPVSFEQLIK